MSKYYKAIKINGQKIDFHRFVVEKVLNRKLKRKEVVHHIDGNKDNNDPDNLSITTRKLHSRYHSRKILSSAKLKPKDIPIIRTLFAAGLKNREIAQKFNVSRRTIADIRVGHTWAWIDSLFKERQSGRRKSNPRPLAPHINGKNKR